jgi:hypothetical protein
METVGAFEAKTQHSPGTWPKALPLAQTFSLSAYDAAYLELVLRNGVPIATLEGKIRRRHLVPA